MPSKMCEIWSRTKYFVTNTRFEHQKLRWSGFIDRICSRTFRRVCPYRPGVIKEIEGDPSLRALVSQCDRRTQTEFQYLVAYRNSAEFKSIMTRIRHSLTFHYDAGTTEKAGLTIARSARRTSRLW